MKKIKAFILSFFNMFNWVDEDRDMGFVPNAMDGIQDDEQD